MANSSERFTPPIDCQHCGNKTVMRVVGHYSQIKDYEQGEAGPYWELAVCPVCSDITLARGFWHDEPVEYNVVYPCFDKSLEGLPPKINQAYQEALRLRNINSNAFAVMLGRVLDEVCHDKKASGGNLYQRLSSLAQNGIVPQQLVDMAHQLRELRNIGAHADLGNLTSAEVPVLDDLCRAILEYVYTAPTLVHKVQLRLDTLKKNNKSRRPAA